jgi:hypothetical protein
VLKAARDSGADAVTWQPKTGLRLAVVARLAAGNAVVVAGQLLAPSEDRDRLVLPFLVAGWLGSIFVLAAGYAATGFRRRRHPMPGVEMS